MHPNVQLPRRTLHLSAHIPNPVDMDLQRLFEPKVLSPGSSIVHPGRQSLRPLFFRMTKGHPNKYLADLWPILQYIYERLISLLTISKDECQNRFLGMA